MKEMEWEGTNRWGDMNPLVQAKAIPLCKQWVRNHVKFILDTRATEAIEDYYFRQESLTGQSDGLYTLLGRRILCSLYALEQAKDG